MRRSTKIPIALVLALAVALGAAVLLVVQINRIGPPPAVVAPIETPPDTFRGDVYIQTITLNLQQDTYAIYPTLAGLGRLQLQANTSGWYYLKNDWIATVARRGTGDVMLNLSNGQFVYVKEINDTHALVYYSGNQIAIVALKIPVGNTGWIIYHPVPTAYDVNVVSAIMSVMYQQNLSSIGVFQPKPDYVQFDPTTKQFRMYYDVVTRNYDVLNVQTKGGSVSNETNFGLVPFDTSIVSDGLVGVDQNDYVLYPTWALLYYYPVFNIKTALAIGPAK
jgi:hypothetical protein